MCHVGKLEQRFRYLQGSVDSLAKESPTLDTDSLHSQVLGL